MLMISWSSASRFCLPEQARALISVGLEFRMIQFLCNNGNYSSALSTVPMVNRLISLILADNETFSFSVDN